MHRQPTRDPSRAQCCRRLVVAVLLAAAALAPAVAAGDWEAFLGPHGNPYSDEVGITTDWPESGPPLLWHTAVGEGYSAPAVSMGRLFHFDRVEDRARLSCLDARTGREIWARSYKTGYDDYYDYSDGPRTSPVVDGDRVYTLGVEGRLRCHRADDGELLWDVDTEKSFGVVQNFFGVGSTPVILDDLLIAQIGGSPPKSPKIHSEKVTGNGSGIVAFDKLTGEVRYRLSNELASYATIKLSRIGSRNWGFAFTRGGLLGFEPKKGTQDFFFPWRAKMLESVNASTPVVVGDTVFLSETYGPGSALLKVRPGSYEVVWQDAARDRDRAFQAHWNTPAYHREHLYGSSGRNTGNAELRAVNYQTGEVKWKKAGLGRASVLYVDGHLLIASENGELRLAKASPESYQEVAFADLTKQDVPTGDSGLDATRRLIAPPVWNGPVLANGIVYLRGKDSLIALELISKTANPKETP